LDTCDHPVKLGSMLFTIVEPHAGHEVAYNRWYERDHFYAGCLIGPFNFAGKRWVATRDLKDRRVTSPVVSDDPARGSFLSMYWILDQHHDDWAGWAGKQVHVLHNNDRMFSHRDHVHTKLYRYGWALHRDEDGVPPELACDHPWKGLIVMIGESTGDRAVWEDGLRSHVLRDIQAGSGIALTLGFSVMPMISDAPGVEAEQGSDRQWLHLHFLDRDPAEVWDRSLSPVSRLMADAGTANVQWTSPFHPTIPGTDTHLDNL